jgi:hypothetical protein
VEVHDCDDHLVVAAAAAADLDGEVVDLDCSHVGESHEEEEEEVHEDNREKDRVRRDHGHLDQEDPSMSLFLLVSSMLACC